MSRSLAGIAVALLIVAGVAGCQPGGQVALKVGECVNYEPSDDGPVTIKVDCAQPHEQEVFLTFDLPNGPFPGLFEIGDAQQDECGSAFKEYVGVPWEKSVYTFDFAGPTEQTWAAGDHTIVCSLEDASGGKLTGSARGTAK